MGRIAFLSVLIGGLAATAAPAAMLVAARTVPAQTVLTATDVVLSDGEAPGAAQDIAAVVGLETQVTLYPGRPVRLADLGPAAMVERNDIVTIRFRSGALVIETEGRALDRAPEGAGVRVMNLASRVVVTGAVAAPGVVEVRP